MSVSEQDFLMYILSILFITVLKICIMNRNCFFFFFPRALLIWWTGERLLEYFDIYYGETVNIYL